MSEPKKKKERTIQVKIGNQAARAMTPDQAADYLKSIAGKGWGSGRELKMTFDNGSTSTVSLPRTAGRGVDDAATSSFPNTTTSSRSTTTRADGMPCSEKEMKALMSMFVEIMGLQMNTDRLNAVKSATKQKKFTFPADLPPPPGGWPEDLMWPMMEDGDKNSGDVDSLPELEAIPESDRPQILKLQKENAQKLLAKAKSARHPQPIPPVPGTIPKEADNDDQSVTGTAGIAPFEWSALERAAIEDALEQEERIRKDSASAKKKKKSVSSAEAAAALQKVEAANKKLDKAVALWRNRVVSATAGNETSHLKDLLAESPLAALQSTIKNSHLEYLVPHTVPKNWKYVASNAESRMVLAKYIVTDFSPVYMYAACRNGRSAAHTACFYADIPMVRLIVEESAKKLGGGQLTEKLQLPCQDSGWAVLQYAVVSGSMRTVEAVFAGCPDYNIPAKLCDAVTNDTHTWKKGTNRGVTARQLAEALLSGKQSKLIETHGMALQEIIAHHKLKNNSTPSHTLYLAELRRIAERLKEIETSGYTPMDEKEIGRMEKEIAKEVEERQRKRAPSSSSTSSTVPPRAPDLQRQEDSAESEDELLKTASTSSHSKKSKKKKKKKGSSTASSSSDSKPPAVSANQQPDSVSRQGSQRQDDPLVSALKGMGFAEDQIMAGVKACGGISRATADDVVAWIFGGGEATGSAAPSEDTTTETNTDTKEGEDSKVLSISKEEAERLNREAARQKEQERIAAEQLAAKREEQRRRNREWNNRAQARQRQEAQEKLVKAAELKAGRLRTTTGLAPASNFLSANSSSGVMPLQGPSSTIGVQQTQGTGGLKLGLDTTTARKQTPNVAGATRQVARLHLNDCGLEKAYSNDASTVASSVDHGSIEVGGNDDATVSTMGSFPAVPPPVPSAYAPPGFADGQGSRELPAAHSQWETQRSLSMGDVYGGSYAPVPGGSGGMGPPPGIPESGPLLDHSGHRLPGMRSHSFNIPTQAGRLTTGQLPFPSGPAAAAPGAPSLLGGPGFSSHPDSQFTGGGMGSTLLGGTFNRPPPRSGALERSSTAPCNASSSSMTSDPVMPGLLGFGSDLKHEIPQSSTLDSSIIDSISTANTAIGGSALWGSDSAAPSGGGSSLLGNLINHSSEFQLHEASNPNGGSSLFSSSSFNSSNQRNNAPGAQWGQDRRESMNSSGGGGGGSIW